jgi:hypothetical protein
MFKFNFYADENDRSTHDNETIDTCHHDMGEFSIDDLQGEYVRLCKQSKQR